MKDNRYCIITPVYNEQDYIERTIQSVTIQTNLPLKWVIVDDASTDSSAAIIKRYTADFPWISYHYHSKNPSDPYYAANVNATMYGYRQLKGLPFDYLAILDADIILPPIYYEKLIFYFTKWPRLGIAGGVKRDLIDGQLTDVLNERLCMPKSIQMFRTNTFNHIGGYLPLKYGGEDTAACAMARMRGWKTWSFPNLCVTHLRATGAGGESDIFNIRKKQGKADFFLGYHPLFFILKALRRCFQERPYIFSGFARAVGYCEALLSREDRQLPSDVKHFVRHEQLRRLFRLNKPEYTFPSQ